MNHGFKIKLNNVKKLTWTRVNDKCIIFEQAYSDIRMFKHFMILNAIGKIVNPKQFLVNSIDSHSILRSTEWSSLMWSCQLAIDSFQYIKCPCT